MTHGPYLNGCALSPTGEHCFHNYVCCWCGTRRKERRYTPWEVYPRSSPDDRFFGYVTTFS